MIGEQKTRQYIIYAVGEILLIVVGILLAFQVNNWDIRKKEERQALELVRNLRRDLMRDTANFGQTIERYRDIYRRRKQVLEASGFENLTGDSLMQLVTPLNIWTNFATPAYGKIENLGLTELAGFGNLYDKVNAYYTTVQNDYMGFIEWDANSTSKEAQFWYYNPNFENYYYEIYVREDTLPAVQQEAERKKELVRLLSKPEVRNMLRTSAMRKKTTIDQLEITRQEAVNLLAAIDSSLAKK